MTCPSATPTLDIDLLTLALDQARAMVPEVSNGGTTLYTATTDVVNRIRPVCQPHLLLDVLHFIELATFEFQSDPSLHGKLVELINRHRQGRLDLEQTILEVVRTRPRSLDLLTFLTPFLPRGWLIMLKVNPSKDYQHDALAIKAIGRSVCIIEVDPPVRPKPFVKGEFFGQMLHL
ncbi:hypothetical protein BD309DRAFT_992827 [Dichomitus squalens]|uniref:Uncharacterized protein n=1 Tax=Dichomitus squalens TaxID=114155 RepID=A0A4Q9PSP7_9APHY|nr:uncharacterized protein DICSQDRAFT_167682 [Dichomitus squalens LYAD-421 SS1]EJF63625.1 hypothetical protein DICSQDRAFT_167682 [Dichomitus squalens LYAD-421 SS1]TBU29353.1 hypothetical protein BD311DRAFT_661129 [Dichomitus squalens]TBU40815.1 hypothetical protein BD309DRAFT_992827 [Dichomitus squalens]TBU57420.1 hypothetical protein BD310DRAFT_821564 [Dichomitus squalens]